MSTLVLVSSDNKHIHVDVDVIRKYSKVIDDMLECMGGDDLEIPIPILAEILDAMVRFCKHHINNKDLILETLKTKGWSNIPTWYKDFCLIDNRKYMHLLLCSDFMDMPLLRTLLVKYMSIMIKGMTSTQIRFMFGCAPLTPDQQNKIDAMFSWHSKCI